jgi:hypothetical protein
MMGHAVSPDIIDAQTISLSPSLDLIGIEIGISKYSRGLLINENARSSDAWYSQYAKSSSESGLEQFYSARPQCRTNIFISLHPQLRRRGVQLQRCINAILFDNIVISVSLVLSRAFLSLQVNLAGISVFNRHPQ